MSCDSSYYVCTIFFQIHLVHFNTKYGGLENANKFPDGRAVVAVFFQVL